MRNCFTPTQRSFQYCHIGPFLTVLRQNVGFPTSSKWLQLPHGISSLLAKSFNKNVFHDIFNCNFITSHLLVAIHKLSIAIEQWQFERFIYHHRLRAFIPPTWTSQYSDYSNHHYSLFVLASISSYFLSFIP